MSVNAAASLAEEEEEESATNGENTDDTSNSHSSSKDPAPILAADAPSYRQLGMFTATTVLIWLSEPLLSLVDTTVVGLTQGSHAVVQLASLGPATTLIDSLLYLTYFLAIATTNQIAASRATGNTRQLQVTTSHTMGVAVVLGALTTALVWLFGQGWLLRMAGASATPLLVQCATDYSCIRAAAAVPAVVGMVAQSVCLATLDTRTPVIAVAAASICNVVGDVLLAPILGVRGAALATAASNVVSTSILLRAVRRQMRRWRAEESDSSSFPPVPFMSWPDRTSLLRLLKLVGPIFFVICAKIACYSAMTLRCTDFGVTALAAHGIMMRLWFFFGCFGDSVSQTAQNFLPATFYPKADAKKFRQVLLRLLGISAGVGLMNWQLSDAVLRFGGGIFTNDSVILQLMRNNRRFIGISLLLHPFIMCLEGTVIAARDFSTLTATYAVTLVVHFGILKFFCPSFPAVWRTFFLFQSIRLVNFSLHVWPKQRMAQEKEAGEAVAASA
jgi:putative MATE family efflux protein